jgi:hypothetical protein
MRRRRMIAGDSRDPPCLHGGKGLPRVSVVRNLPPDYSVFIENIFIYF